MKKRISYILTICILVLCFAGCGKNEGSGGILSGLTKETKNLTIATIDSSMIEAGFYGEGEGYSVLCGFLQLSDGQGICVMAVSANGVSATATAGKYEPSVRTDEDGMEISNIVYTDAYTGLETSLGFVQENSVSDNAVSYDASVITSDNNVYDLYKTDSADFVNRLANFGLSSYSKEMVITTWVE